MCMCLVLFVVSKILDSSELLSCLLEMGVEHYLVCIREGLLCGKGVEPPRGRGRLSGVRESQQFLRSVTVYRLPIRLPAKHINRHSSNQSNRVDYTDLIICGHRL